MTLPILGLVLLAAVAHAVWNLLAKGGQGGQGFVWLYTVAASVLYLPVLVVALIIAPGPLGWEAFVFMAGSGALHTVYASLLQRGYRTGDLSLVYPLARGAGPAIATAGAIVVFAERPSRLALLGGLLVLCGLVALSQPRRLVGRDGARAGAAIYAMAAGSVIAAYTLWDAHAVAAVAIPPLLLEWASNAVRTALLAPLAVPRRAAVGSIWREHRTEALSVAVLSPLAYILVLTALVSAPVSAVAPTREVSIVIGTAMGAWLLGEAAAMRRFAAAAVIVVGVSAIAVG